MRVKAKTVPQFCSVRMSADGQVFGRPATRTNHTLPWPAAEKRQGTKSRQEVAGKQRRGRVVPQRLWGFGQAGDAGDVRAREVETVFCSRENEHAAANECTVGCAR